MRQNSNFALHNCPLSSFGLIGGFLCKEVINIKCLKQLASLLSVCVFCVGFIEEAKIDLCSAESSNSFPSYFADSSITPSDYAPYITAIKENQSLLDSGLDTVYVCFGNINNQGVYTFLINPLYSDDFTRYNRSMSVYYGTYSGNAHITLQNIDDYNFTFTTINSLPSSASGGADRNAVIYNSSDSQLYQVSAAYDNNGISYNYSSVIRYIAKIELIPQFDPILSPILDYPYNLDIQSQGFTEWLINTEKYKEIKSSMIANHVSPFVELFNQYGGSLTFFRKYVKQYFDLIHIGDGVSDYGVILKKTRELYQEYLRLKSDTVGSHLAPRVSSTIEPETNDNNQTLITNTVNDTEIEKILRDILRTLLSFPSTWYDMHQQLMQKLDELQLTTNIVNDGGSNDLDVLFNYDQEEFESDWNSFEDAVNDEVNSKTALVDNINNRSVMPEKMLSDQNSFSLTVPLIDGYTVSQDGTSYTTSINNYTFDISQHPEFDAVFKKIKRFSGIILIIAYLVSLRFRIPRIVRGES